MNYYEKLTNIFIDIFNDSKLHLYFILKDDHGNIMKGVEFKVVDKNNESIIFSEGITDDEGKTPPIYVIPPKEVKIIYNREKYLNNLEDFQEKICRVHINCFSGLNAPFF